MKCLIFQHYLIKERNCLISAETDGELPDKYWKFLGIVEAKNDNLLDKLKTRKIVEISEEMFEIDPSINQLL